MGAAVGALLSRKSLGAALFALSVLLVAPPAHATPAFLKTCERLLKTYFPNPEFIEDRAKRYLPVIEDANREAWRKRLATAPEAANGLSSEEALRRLARLKSREDPAQGGRLVRNATSFVSLGEGQAAVVKRVHERSEMGDSRVYNFKNDVRKEVLAFVIDRLLGTNMVPPALLLSHDTVAMLKIRARITTEKKAAGEPVNLMDLSHMRLLDMLLGNADRGGPDNLLALEDGKLVAIDFDLSRPTSFTPVEAAEFSLTADGVVLEPELRLGRKGSLPGVFAKSVLVNLRALTRAKLVEAAGAAGLTLSANEINNALSAAQASLQVIEVWKRTYGADLIEVP